jgi:hypothetical protein
MMATNDELGLVGLDKDSRSGRATARFNKDLPAGREPGHARPILNRGPHISPCGHEPAGFLLNGSHERPGRRLFLCLHWHCANQQIHKQSSRGPLHINLHIY